MKSLGRRGILKMLGVGGIGLTAAGSVPVGPHNGGILGPAFGTMVSGYPPPEEVGVTRIDPSWLLRESARKLLRVEAGRQQERQSWRLQGFDHDIWALRSIPLTSKVRMQRMRDEAPATLLEKLRKEAWGDE